MCASVRFRSVTSCLALTLLMLLCVAPQASADTAPKWTDAQLTGFSDVIVRGRVTSVAVASDASGVYTYVSLDVAEVLKGAIADRQITIKQLGGRIGSTALQIAGQPTFEVGEDALLFLEVRPRDHTLSVTAQWQGKFTIKAAANGGLAARQTPGVSTRGVLSDSSRVADAWLDSLRRLVREAPAASSQAIDTSAPARAIASSDPGWSSAVGAVWNAASVRVDRMGSGQSGLRDGGEKQLNDAAAYWTAAGLATLETGGLQPSGCFSARLPDGRISVGVDSCGELSPTGGTLALSGGWIDYSTDAAAFLGGGVITNGGAAAAGVFAQASCFGRVAMHELGHTLGLADSADGTGVMAPLLVCDSGFGSAISTDAAGVTLTPAGAQNSAPGPMFVPQRRVTAGSGTHADATPKVACAVGCAITVGAGVSTPTAPTNLTASLSGSTLTLSWTALGIVEAAPTSYIIEAGTGAGKTDVANFSTGSTATTLVLAVGGNVTLFVRVRATNSAGTSDPSNEVSVIVGNPTTVPGPPTGLVVAASGSTVALSWTAPTTGVVTSYVIEAGTSPGLVNLANFSTGNSLTSFSAAGVGSGTYFVRVRSSNASGVSAPSNEAVLIVGASCGTLGAPSNLTAAVSGSTVILGWTAGSGATSYRLQVGSSPGKIDLLDTTLPSTSTTLTATNVGSGSYFVRLRSLNSCSQSAASNEVLVFIK